MATSLVLVFCEPVFVPLRSSWGRLWAPQLTFRAFKNRRIRQEIQRFLKNLRFRSEDGLESVLGPSWASLGRSWGSLGGLLGPSGVLLGCSWGLLGASWAPLGSSWGHVGGDFGLSWGFLRLSWPLLWFLRSARPLVAPLRSSWGRLWAPQLTSELQQINDLAKTFDDF